MSERVDAALQAFEDGFNCAQAVFAAFAAETGLAREQALRVAGGFGAGMGRLQEVCGAVSGAFMVLGCRHGMTVKGDAPSKETAYARVRQLAERFAARHGSIRCRDLLGCDLTTEEGQRLFKENDLHHLKCARYVADCARLLEEPPA